MKKIYIAGPMRGIPQFNFPAFFAAQKKLESEGWEVFNPAEDDVKTYGTDISKGNSYGDEELAAKDFGFSLRDALAKDCEFICKEADAIFMLDGWENSKGASAERALAVALGHEVLYE